ncbi:MAG: asnB [Bacillales bacterium]|nr:asnB [Bacillales bacterium]
MCGITGWIEFDRLIKDEIDTVYKMTNTLSKRGPDATRYWANRHVGFGHKRLAVVDPVGGSQPMVRKKNGYKYVMIYNGELYNTEDIRKELISLGYTFEGHSDTEVLLDAYIEWGENCLEKLNGIFAFAVWDESLDRVFIARDRLGVKPLFFAEHDKGLLFGSELKAILAHKKMHASIDLNSIAELFGLGPSRMPGSGFYKGIRELRPGHWLIFDRKGLKIKRYWNVVSKRHEESLEETIEQVRELVKDAVIRQLVSDVPLCTFLSGGLDSSTISAIASDFYRENNNGQLNTYSIDYEENAIHFKPNEFQPNSDAHFIGLIKNKFDTKHHSVVVSQADLVNALEESMVARDMPGMADIDSSLLLFSKEIRKDFVVGLSGECADEIFGGYPWFYREDDLKNTAFPWMRSTNEREELLSEGLRSKLNLGEFIQSRFDETVAETPLLEGESAEESSRRKLFYMNMIWFMTTLLDRKDRMTMATSLEVRVPFADHRLVEYAWNIPWEMKNAGGMEKGILRSAFSNLLPNEIVNRKKSPFPKTHHPLYTKYVQDKLTEILRKKDSVLHEFFSKEKLLELIESGGSSFKKPWFGQLMSGPQLLAYLIQVHQWFEKYRVKIEI